jgi:ribonucleoside-diphosphate reductase alpha chain
MKIQRVFTSHDKAPDSYFNFEKRSSVIKNPDGRIIFEMTGIDIPSGWTQVATDIIAQKYFRKAGVPRYTKKVSEKDVPSWLQRSVPDKAKMDALPPADRYTSESDSRQVFNRLAGTWTYWGWKHNYFDSEDDARALYDELFYMLARQMAAPNSPPVVQYGAKLGLRYRWTLTGAFLCGSQIPETGGIQRCLHSSATPCLLYSKRERQSRQ